MTERSTLITGAGGALGSAIAQHLLARGQRVHAVIRPSADEPPNWTQHASCRVMPIDILDEQSWSLNLKSLDQPLTGAVLCAGGWSGGAPHHLTDSATWDQMLESNLQTAQVSLRVLIPRLQGRSGSIVAIGSRAAVRPWESAGSSAYAASKAALVALVAAVAQENLGTGVRINALLPSTIDTPSNRRAMPNAEYDRWVSPAEIASVTEFLLSQAASGVTGAAIPVYGRV